MKCLRILNIVKHNHAFPFVFRNKQKKHFNPPTTRISQTKKIKDNIDATKKNPTKKYTITYSKNKKNPTINLKLFMIRKNACHEMSLIRKQLLTKLTSKCQLSGLFFN